MKCKRLRINAENLISFKHKRDILGIISEGSTSGKGFTITQIVKESKAIVPKRYGKQSGLTRPTVTKYVNALSTEGKIIKDKNKYFLVDDIIDDGRFEFAIYLQNLLLIGHIPEFELDSIKKSQKDGQPSPGNKTEDELLQIAIRIGAFIAYVFIESMSPTGKIVPRKMRMTAGVNFIENAISLSYLFRIFVNMIPSKYFKDNAGMEMSKARYDQLTNTLSKVFPALHKSIEEMYPSFFDAIKSRESKLPSGCGHEWKEMSVYKIGKRYRCTKCRRYNILPSHTSG